MKKIVFYSWQSDLPNPTNRSFIQIALERATAAIAQDDTIEVDPVIDRDTQGLAGSPDISATIFKKIALADVFVADVTIIGRTDGGRPTPNPNVLIELGYAIRCLDYSRVVLIYNTAFGAISDLPFDLKTRRVLAYEMGAETAEKSEERKRLTNTLKNALVAALSITKNENIPESIQQALITAIETKAPNRKIKLRQFLKSLLSELDKTAPEKFSDGGTVDALINGLNKTRYTTLSFAQLCQTVAVMDDVELALEIHNWFGGLIERYDVSMGFHGRINDYDFDFYKFMGQEWYVIFIACLLKEEKLLLIQQVLNHWIPISYLRGDSGPANVKYTELSQFVGSLYYEGEKQSKMSLQGLLEKDRFESDPLREILSFSDYMSADLLLFLAVELREEKPMEFWVWRAVSFLYLKTLPSFLAKAQRTSFLNPIMGICQVESLEKFKERLSVRLPKLNRLFVGGAMHFWPIKRTDLDKLGTIAN